MTPPSICLQLPSSSFQLPTQTASVSSLPELALLHCSYLVSDPIMHPTQILSSPPMASMFLNTMAIFSLPSLLTSHQGSTLLTFLSFLIYFLPWLPSHVCMVSFPTLVHLLCRLIFLHLVIKWYSRSRISQPEHDRHCGQITILCIVGCSAVCQLPTEHQSYPLSAVTTEAPQTMPNISLGAESPPS